jgi:hypothetical protein
LSSKAKELLFLELQELHLDDRECAALALDIEESAYGVAVREPERSRTKAYVHAASRLLLSAVVRQASPCGMACRVESHVAISSSNLPMYSFCNVTEL